MLAPRLLRSFHGERVALGTPLFLIGLFPFVGFDFGLLCRPFYHVQKAQSVRQAARTKRFSADSKSKGELYPDWEQACDRWRHKLQHLVLPASSFISVDRVNDSGDIR